MSLDKQKPFVLWLTGLSGSGKTTLAKEVVLRLSNLGMKVHHLDGDEVRAAAVEPMGFDRAGRDKNIRLALELAAGYQAKGYSVVASFISPYRHHRQWGRERLASYVEVFVDAPLQVCEQRDPKGLYKKARAEKTPFFTGISDPYEAPEFPDVHIKTHQRPLLECADEVVAYLEQNVP